MLSWSARRHKALNSFEISFALLSFLVVLGIWIVAMIGFGSSRHYDGVAGKPGEQINYFYQNRSVFSGNYLLFFTNQTNLLCIFLMLLAGSAPHLKGKIKLLRPKFVLAVASYIAITGSAFDAFLLPDLVIHHLQGVWLWIGLVWEHNVLPIGFIVWASKCIPVDGVITVRYWQRQWLGRATLYPLLYVGAIVLRGVLIFQGVQHTTVNGQSVFYHGQPAYDNNFFLYYMLNVFDRNYGVPGWLWLTIAVSFNFLVLVGVSYAGLRLNNHLVARRDQGRKQMTPPFKSERLVALGQKLS